jgi:hypothetical protein
MKKEYIISRIEASQDGAPYVYVTFAEPNDYKAGSEKQQNPFGPNMMACVLTMLTYAFYIFQNSQYHSYQ